MNTTYKKQFFIISSLVLVALVFVFIFLIYLKIFSPIKKDTTLPSPTPRPVSTDLDADYSSLNHIVPGKSTRKDVEKINGAPGSVSVFGDKTYLYYNTPMKQFRNKVLIRDDMVVYSLEHVFSNYRGFYDDYVGSFGNPDVVLYNSDPYEFPWYIFLKKGLAIQSNNNFITGIVYFSPQSQALFMKNIAGDLGLSEQEPAGKAGFTAP